MKCLVTGANGFVGSHVVRTLMNSGRYEPVAFVRKDTDITNLEGLEVEIRYGDLRDYHSIEKAVSGCKFVFHVGAVYLFWSRNPSIFYEVNVGGTVKLLDAAEKKGVERVVYTSTTGAIGLSKDDREIDESALFNPPEWFFDPWKLGDHYSRSKILAQKEVLRRAREGMDIVIVAPSAPIGWGDYKPTPTGLLILKFLNRGIPFFSDLGLSLVNVRDVARGHLLALEMGKRGDIYILGGHNIYLSDFFKILSRMTGLAQPLKLPRKLSGYLGYVIGLFLEIWAKITGRPPLITRAQARASQLNLFYSSAKAKDELGYEITPLEYAVRDAVEFFVKKCMVKKKIASRLEEKLKKEQLYLMS